MEKGSPKKPWKQGILSLKIYKIGKKTNATFGKKKLFRYADFPQDVVNLASQSAFK